MNDKTNKIEIPEMKNKIVIISVHCDDEIIGCYEIIRDNPDNPPVILYVGEQSQNRRDEAMKLREHAKITMQMFCKSVPPIFMNPSTQFYICDVIYDTHPLHRMWGSQGENMLRNGLNVTFYNTNMNAPYIHEVEGSQKKEELLNKVYPSQKRLWEYDKKYILFEGRCKWIM
jgi:hypothetical protein